MWLSRPLVGSTPVVARCELPLGPVTRTIKARPTVVFDVIAAPYLHRTPRAMAPKLRVVDRGSDLVVADHFTPILGGRLCATTRETVAFAAPSRVSFRLLSGPVALVEEEYRLDPEGEDGTLFTYVGRLGSNLPLGAKWWASKNAEAWTKVVERSIAEIAAEAERRAAL
jgi:hypothetical protein